MFKHPPITGPKIVCLCGSTRFSKEYQEANLHETLDGNIVLTIGADMKSDSALFADKSPEELDEIKQRLNRLHLAKIDLSDEVLVLNAGGYIGDSTRNEINYALKNRKLLRFLVSDDRVLEILKTFENGSPYK